MTNPRPPAQRAPARAPRTWFFAWLIATLLIVVAFRAAGWRHVAEIGHRLNAGWLVVAVCGNLAIQPFAAIQWRLLLPSGRRVRLRKMLSVAALSAMAMNTAPALLGHASMVMLLARQPGIGHGTALSVLALEQLTESIAKMTVVLLAILVLPVPAWMQHSAVVLACIVALFTVALLLAAHNHELLARWAHRSTTASGKRSPLAIAAGWADRLETLRTPRRFLAALLACFGMKLVEGLAIIATQHALGVHLPASASVLILAAAGVGTMLPLAPGNLGTYEAAVFLAYKWLGVSAGDALALSVVQHLAYLAAATGAGYAVLSLRQLRAVRARRV